VILEINNSKVAGNFIAKRLQIVGKLFQKRNYLPLNMLIEQVQVLVLLYREKRPPFGLKLALLVVNWNHFFDSG
jgi:hypothetical protein